ncbi:pyridoxamine 5'-phosphate oxidase family protein [Sodalis sp. RH19]|uniref:pyridoxamine 5'-phosphate oxidase family protein n=1 Tax=Sodalis sp. RH19 TaxID=3394334 RepID=UPI0039B63DE5
MPQDDFRLTTAAQLEAIYGAVAPPSIVKETDYLHPAYRPFIEAAPFAVLATAGGSGLDASPRGDPAGFVHIEDSRTLLLPDRRGNNRIDSLRNIVEDPRVALLFLIPGIGETLRVNGTADISVEPALLARFAMAGNPPRTVLRIRVQSVFFQCSRAVIRARLWDPATQIARDRLPSAGTVLKAISNAGIDGDAYDQALPDRLKKTLY